MAASCGGNRTFNVCGVSNGLLSQGFASRGVIDRQSASTTIDELTVDVVLIIGFGVKGIDRQPPWSIAVAL